MTDFQLSAFQERVLMVPEGFDLFLGGGRGGGKSTTMALLALRHVEQYAQQARVLYLRRTYKGAEDFAQLCQSMFASAYDKARYNAQERLWRFPNGGTMELGQLEGDADYPKYQGRSFTLLLVDEAGQYPQPRLLDLLRSNLRGPKDVPVRMVLAANPGDVGHAWLSRRYVFNGAAPWRPFRDEGCGRTFVYAPSVYTDNHFIQQDAYRKQLEAACATDPELLRAWLSGDWAVSRGAYFAGVLDATRVATEPWGDLPRSGEWQDLTLFQRKQLAKAGHRGGWEYSLAHDFGVSAPSVTYIVARSPGGTGPDGRFYPRGSLILVDELATNEPGQLNTGLGWTVPQLAEAIRALCSGWVVNPSGCADDAIFARTGSGAGSIAEEFRRNGVHFSPARKADRRTGWEVMRRMLSDAGKPDRPGLYVSRLCTYFWETVPYLARDPKRPDDVDTRGPDHSADAVRYACLYQKPYVGVLDIPRVS